MKKALIVTSVASMIQQFNMINIKLLQNLGFDVDVACNFEIGNTISNKKIDELKAELQKLGVNFFQVDFSRNITDVIKHVRSYNQLQKIVEADNYSFVHCQAPIAGIITRLIKYPSSKVIYTAHGFHFYKGAPKINWLMLYPLERFFSRKTNHLITINKEDYHFAKKKFYAQNLHYVHGVGLATKKFENIKPFNLDNLKNFDDDLVFMSIGELNDNKNQQQVINDLEKIRDRHFIYIICGVGKKREYLEQLIKEKGLENKIFLLGYREDIPNLLAATNVYIHPSKREGLPVSVMEAMYTGVPICCSNIRGNVDLVRHEVNGYLVDLNNSDEGFDFYLSNFFGNERMLTEMGEKSIKLINPFLEKNVIQELEDIYSSY